ncbi:MAG: glycoside hydrolase family 1 protein [Lactobacillales bacterium]|jgi:6-phospho-beta-glucosidase|nr:glycoside hydrolase family 1 protein [Lactobacillales bacterium]
MSKNYTFPAGFWWGSAASGPQTEGRYDGDGKGDSLWDYWFEQEPEKFFGGVGPERTSRVYKMYKEDARLMKETGHNSFRTSIQWSRLIPDATGEVNPEAVKFYNDYFDELIANGVEPFVGLFHFDMPMALQNEGGWLNRKTVDAYARYAKIAFELFGDKVKRWFTYNEPIVPVEGGYLYDFHYPNHKNMKEAMRVMYHEIVAQALAIKEFHEGGFDGTIGVVLNLTPSYPRDPENPEDVKAAKLADALFNRSFLDPSILGTLPEELKWLWADSGTTPDMLEGDAELIANNTIDLLGINYYQPRRIKAKETPVEGDGKGGPMPEDYFDNYDWPEKKMNPYRGWEIYEKGIYDCLINVKENYGNIDCYISENGMGVEGEERYIDANGEIQDDYRIEFVRDHLKWVHQAIAEGSNCHGYHMWTCMDCWSWTNAYKNRYGFIAVDLDNDGARTVKKSGKWFHQVVADNGFEA